MRPVSELVIVVAVLVSPQVFAAVGTAPQDSAVSHQHVMQYTTPGGSVQPVLSAAHWALRRQEILNGMQEAMGPLPAREDLPDWDPVVTEEKRYDDVRRITMTIVVEDNDRLPLDLYLPAAIADQVDVAMLLTAKSELRLPAVVALHPTGAPGKRIVAGEGGRLGRQYGLELAQRGYVTICPDYPPFGDYAYDFESDDYVSGTMKGIFNHMRCVDLLCTLPFVDANRIGVIGHSLGGHNAMFLGVFDERVQVIVSSCGWTPFHDYYGGNITGWTSDRYMPRLRDVYELDPDKVPFDFPEVVAALAPRTFVSVSPEHDSNFDVAGVRKAIPEAQQIYTLLGAAEELILKTPDCEHDFPTDMRIQSYAVIDRVLQHTPVMEIASDYSSELPRIAPLEPAEALKSFQVAEGFQLQLTAAEPLVTDPVAMSFDADGRLYVVEMKDYSEQADDHLGQVRLLTDHNDDGVFDDSQVFADGLSWPTAITCWDGGVFVGAAPDIFYLKDTTGDGRADQSDVIFTGFGRGNVQGLLNSFQWGPDNRIYGATSSAAGVIRCVPFPDHPEIDLRSRDFSFDPGRLDLRPESGGAQHGACFDDWGNRFVCSNSDHAQAILYDDRYLTGTPGLAAAPPRISIAVDGGQAPVFRISPVEPWRIVRTRLRVAGMVGGPVEGGGRGRAGYFTGSTGITVYRGDAWPEDMKGTLIVGDVGSNIIHRKRVESDGVGWKAYRIDEQSELVASRDNWFRPVQFANAPDGCLHVLDMYREVIEHPASLPPEIKQHLDLTSGRDRGRLYRIAPADWSPRPFQKLSAMSTAELVRLLDHSNGWHRETAQRLLFERQDADAVGALRALLNAETTPAGWLGVLASLHGLSALIETDVLAALRHPHARVRVRAIRLAEEFAAAPAVVGQLAARTTDPDPRVRLQLAFSLSRFDDELRRQTLSALLQSDGSDPWIRSGVLTSLGALSTDVWEQSVRKDSGVDRTALLELTGLVARSADDAALSHLASVIGDASAAGTGQQALLQQIFSVRSTARNHPAFRELVGRLLENARRTIATTNEDAETRAVAVEHMRLSTFSDDGALLSELLSPGEPPVVQQTALRTLSTFPNAEIADLLITGWPELSPAIRLQIPQLLLSRATWSTVCLNAMADGKLPANFLSSAELMRLTSHSDTSLASLAQKLIASQPVSSREDVIRRYMPALSLTGDLLRGNEAFRKHCSNCHRVGGFGFEVGPNLATVRNRGAETILVNVLDPNREVNPAWRDYLVLTHAGTVHNGVIVSETGTSLTLRRAEGKEETLLRSDIESIRDTGRSLMPEGLEKEVNPQTLTDIITWIMTAEELDRGF